MRIIVSEFALETTDVRNFPESSNRSARVHKKLVKRFGGEFRKTPTIFQTPLGMVIHPTLYETLKKVLR